MRAPNSRPLARIAAQNSRTILLCLLYFLSYGSNAAWMPFFNVYLRQIELSGLQIGLLAGTRPAIVLVSQPVWGIVADLWGRQRTLLFSMFCAGTLLLGYIWGQTFAFFFAWTIVHTFLANPVNPLIDSLVLDHLEERRASSFGRMRLWGALGWGLVAVVIGYLVTGRDLRLIFVGGTVLMLGGWLAALRAARRSGTEAPLLRSWRGVGQLLRNRTLLIFLVLVTLLQTGMASIFTFYPVYMDELGASRQLIGIAYTVQGLSELPLYLSAAAIIRRIGLNRTLVFTMLVFAVRLFCYSVIVVPSIAVAVEVLHGLSFSLFLVASVDYINRQVPSTWRATGQALFWASYFGAGAILGNTWSGFLYDQIGIQAMFLLNGSFVLLVALIAAVALRPGDRAPVDTASSSMTS